LNDLAYTAATPDVELVFQAERYGGSYDIQWHKEKNVGLTPQQQLNQITLIGGPTSTVEITSVTPSSQTVVGQTVCKSGISGHYLCGEIIDVNRSVEVNYQIGTLVKVHNANNLALALAGDSGGPVFIGNSALGTVQGRGNENDPDANDMYYMPVERFSVLGISVLTKPFKITSIPNVTAQRGGPSVTVSAHFQGVPKFPVKRAVTNVTCPSGSSCNNGTQTYSTNIASPFTWTASCSGVSSTTTVAKWRAIFTDASGIATPAVDYTITCTPNALTKALDSSDSSGTIGDDHAN